MPRYLAFDWDHNQLHVVAANIRGNKVKIERAAVLAHDLTPPVSDPEAIGRQVREQLKNAGIAAAPVLVSLARDRVILKDIRFPNVPEAEEANVIRFQAVKELTDPADEVIIDYAPVTDRGAVEQRAMALVVRKDLFNSYQAICQAAGLKLAAVTPRPFGVAAAVVRATHLGGPLTPPPEPADAAVAVITVGDKWAEFCVLRNDTLLLTRTLAAGPGLAGEIRRNLTVFNGQNPQRPVQALYLSAGPNAELRQRLGDMVEVPIYPYDPFAGSEIEVPGNPGGFAGAVGLIVALAEKGRVPVNFADPRKALPPSNPYVGRALVAAALVLVSAIALLITGRRALAEKENEVVTLENQALELAKQSTANKEGGKRTKAIDDWEQPVLLDEIYDLTDRMNVDDLRILTIMFTPITRAGKNPSPYVTKMTVDGEFVDPVRGRRALDGLFDQFKSKSDREFYLLSPPVVKDNNKFNFSVQIKRREPKEYPRRIALPEKP